MPRDATDTRERLLREARRLFATRGVLQTTSREIVEAAGQRNVSALTYHFGSREGVLRAILVGFDEVLDAERGELLARIGTDASTRDLVAALLVPYARPLATADGREYLRIVAQLTERFPEWREPTLTGPYLRRILGILERRPSELRPAIRRERVVSAITLMTAAMAERARLVSEQRRGRLDDDSFLANLADMIVGVLEAPPGPALG
ncbi:MAG TPA: TetR family transcriptional regulator [Acidimicrobiales bacterium]|nr:TetR family transcriptional regulator [Acidimicrobiales bacterium]